MTLIGHDDAWKQWREAMSGARMHHAWLLAGKSGLGKAQFANSAARELVGDDGNSQNMATHPDVIILTHLPKDEKEEKKRQEGKPYELKRNITIGQIREMQRRLNTRPTMGDRRVVIIDPADDLEKNASNALLKSLEEPPVGTFFMLVAHRPARLLPTIRSRCRVMRFAPLSDEIIAQFLSQEAPEADGATRDAAIRVAAGSPGLALDFVSQDLASLDRIMREIAAKGDPDFRLRGQLSAAIGPRPDRERISSTLDLARAVLASRMTETAPSQIPALVDAHADLVRLSAQAPIYNFDAGLLVLEIGSLLAKAANPREAA